ncbi:MAG: 50S ribosomal protein L24 [Christensenellales bacterium]
MAKLNVKRGDNVVVLTGKENGKKGTVAECFPEEGKVTVKGLNMIVKHNKPRSAQDKGGIVKKEGKIDSSNVMIVCPACNKATRVKMEVNAKGEKVRVCKKCGASLDSKKVEPKKTESKKEATADAPAKKAKSANTEAKKTATAKTSEKKTTAKTAVKKETKKQTASEKTGK